MVLISMDKRATKYIGGIKMKRTFKMENLDCANCAAKMEERINRLDGVNSAVVSFATQRLVLDADDEAFDSIVEECRKVCRKIDRGTNIIV